MKRSGFTIAEMLITLSLITVAMTLSSKLLSSVLRSQARLAAANYQASVLDQAVHRLRIDLESSPTLQTSAETVQLSGVRWQADSGGLTRMSGTQQERFDLSTVVHLSANASVVVLRVGDATWMLSAPVIAAAALPPKEPR